MPFKDSPVSILVLSLLLVATFWDLKFREIPDWISLALVFAGCFCALNGPQSACVTHGLAFVLAASVGCVLYATGAWGGGDVKLLGALGVVFGLPGFLTVLFWMALAGGALALVAAFRRQKEFAYGPAIAFGAFCAVPRIEISRMLTLDWTVCQWL